MSAFTQLQTLFDELGGEAELIGIPASELLEVVRAAERVDLEMIDDGSDLDAESFGLRLVAMSRALAELEESIS